MIQYMTNSLLLRIMQQLMKLLKVVRMIKEKLIKEFARARNDNSFSFVILEIVAEGIREFIVIPRESFTEKLSFYKRSYTDELVHVMNKNVAITSFAAVKSLSDTMFI